MNHTGHPANDDPKVIEALGFREWTNEVHSNRIPWFRRDGQWMKFTLGLLIGVFGTLASFAGAAIVPHLVTDRWPPVPTSNVLISTLAPEVSQSGVCLVEYPNNQFTIMGHAHHLVALGVGVPDKVVVNSEALIVVRLL